MIYITSDTHYLHYKILEYCSRPFKDVSHMNEHLIANWNSRVQEGDVVYHLGDFFMGNPINFEKVLVRLNSYKNIVLVAGNHDKKKTKELFDPSKVFDQYYLEYKGSVYWMSHRPINNIKRPQAQKAWNYALCGHSHSEPENRFIESRCMDVGVDGNYYYPYSIDEIKDLCENNLKRNEVIGKRPRYEK